jgi:hemolysin-activating ACP:hemolysin acyltransferase
MHSLFEVKQALKLVGGDIEDGCLDAERVASVRVGMVLMGLSRSPLASSTSLTDTFEYLSRAETSGSLQVFLDRDGVRRGHAIVAFLDDAADAAVRSDPRLALNDLSSSEPAGACAWLVALFGGPGQGLAIVRHLRDNLLRRAERLSYVRQNAGSIMLKTLEVGHRPGLPRPSSKPASGADFSQLKLRLERYRRFYHYSRLLRETDDYDLSVGVAIEHFGHSNALRQYHFDNDERPTSYLNWALLGEDAVNRLESDRQARLRPGDWLSGNGPCVVDLLGGTAAARTLLDGWLQQHALANSIRFLANSSSQSRFAGLA